MDPDVAGRGGRRRGRQGPFRYHEWEARTSGCGGDGAAGEFTFDTDFSFLADRSSQAAENKEEEEEVELEKYRQQLSGLLSG